MGAIRETAMLDGHSCADALAVEAVWSISKNDGVGVVVPTFDRYRVAGSWLVGRRIQQINVFLGDV
jgi:hypothetical protein